MGQAKQRREKSAHMDEKLRHIDVARVADAINKLSIAASEKIGADCLLQTMLAQHILDRLGCESQMCIGFAAWRVAQGDGDVIAHLPLPGMDLSDPRRQPFHAWLRIGSHILDVTTSQLELKAAQLDSLDGGTTRVDWSPEYLLTPIEAVSTYERVAQGGTGLFFYREDAQLRDLVMANEPQLDEYDANLAWQLYQSPNAVVIGPYTTLRDRRV